MAAVTPRSMMKSFVWLNFGMHFWGFDFRLITTSFSILDHRWDFWTKQRRCGSLPRRCPHWLMVKLTPQHRSVLTPPSKQSVLTRTWKAPFDTSYVYFTNHQPVTVNCALSAPGANCAMCALSQHRCGGVQNAKRKRRKERKDLLHCICLWLN